MSKWTVTGSVWNNRGGKSNKTVSIKAPTKEEAIAKGLAKLDTKDYVSARLVQA